MTERYNTKLRAGPRVENDSAYSWPQPPPQPRLPEMTAMASMKWRLSASLSPSVDSLGRASQRLGSLLNFPQVRLSTSPNTFSMISLKNSSDSVEPQRDLSAFFAHDLKSM